jgi:hypothetical protein
LSFIKSTARDLSIDQKLNFGDDITGQLRLAKKHHFSKQEEKRIAQEIELQVSWIDAHIHSIIISSLCFLITDVS